jgi:hypothetical protein
MSCSWSLGLGIDWDENLPFFLLISSLAIRPTCASSLWIAWLVVPYNLWIVW